MDEAAKANFDFQKIIAVVGVSLMAIKFVAYFLTGSVAILTDALESIVNVVAAFVGLYALYLSAQPADKSHPFGHGKIENISAIVEGTMILVAGGLIIYESILSFLNPGEIKQLDIGLVIVGLAALVNYAVGKAAIRRGKKSRSPALVASGKHLCSDTYSSIGIILGLLVVYAAIALGYDAAWLDSSIAIIFGVIIGYTGIGVIKQSIDDSMDRNDDIIMESLTRLLNEYRHDDWIDIYKVRLIKYGHGLFVDLHLVLPRDMAVTESYEEESQIEEAIKWKFGENVEVSVTAAPCSDLFCRFCDRNCFNRCEEFQKLLKWTPDSLMTPQMHSPPRVITIDGSINGKD
jgi:cation diffusion facilitator family transporter